MNRGASPIDPATPVGALRLLVGDTEGIALTPPEPGFLDYSVWSDDALESVLAAQGDNQLRAAGTLYLQLAAQYTQSGRSIKTDDLALDTKSRGSDLLKIAQAFIDEATANDNAAANDFFQIIPFGGRRGRNQCCVRPEGTPHPLTCC
jgi:hypothetical protein